MPTHRHPLDKRGSRAWRRLVARVVEAEPLCRLRLDGCTYLSETADHIIPVVERPELCMVRANLRGACHACNLKRGARPLERPTDDRPAGVAEFFG